MIACKDCKYLALQECCDSNPAGGFYNFRSVRVCDNPASMKPGRFNPYVGMMGGLVRQPIEDVNTDGHCILFEKKEGPE